MVVPAIGRELAAADGGRLAATAAIVIGTLIVPRPAGGWLHPQRRTGSSTAYSGWRRVTSPVSKRQVGPSSAV
jgi:hypothetical protein